MDVIDAWAEMLSKCDEPKNACIEEIYAYWGTRFAVALRKMYDGDLPEVDIMDKLNDTMREFVPKIEKILKGEK